MSDEPSSSAREPPAPSQLERILEQGVRGDDLEALRAVLGLPPETREPVLVDALLRRLHAERIARIRLPKTVPVRPASSEDAALEPAARASFLVRLTSGSKTAHVDIERLDDLRTLLALLRAGRLRQRRAAALRLGHLLEAPRGISPELLQEAMHALEHMRSFAIEYELSRVTERLPGPSGRAARAAAREWDALRTRLQQDVQAFWDGESTVEPVMALGDEARVHLLCRVRDLSDELVRHLSAVIGGTDGVSSEHDRTLLLGALQSAGDARLLPALRMLLMGPESKLFVPAARALGRIDDPRAHGVLCAAYETSAIAEHRLVVAGALAHSDDARGLPYARKVLAAGDERLLPYALEAIAYLGGAEDVLAVAAFLEHADQALVMAAVETLGRIGDGRALLPLSKLRSQAKSSALNAAAEEAETAIAARLDLIGEEPPSAEPSRLTFDTAKMTAWVKQRDPAVVRLRARLTRWLAFFWLLFGANRRAIAQLEAAAVLEPRWAAPLVQMGILHAREGEHAQALASFRRALELDRSAVEKNGTAMQLLAQAFLHRAEAVADAGRADVARGLLEEALALDLRRAPSNLRYALSHRLDALRQG